MIGNVNQGPVGDLASLTTTAQTSAVAAINELDALIGAAASSSGSIGTSIDTDGTLKAGAVDVEAVLADNVVTAAKIADNVVGAGYSAGSDLTLEAASDRIGAAASSSGSIGTSIDTDGTLKSSAVDVAAVLADGVVTAAKLLPGAFALQNQGWDAFNAYLAVGENIANLTRWPFTTGVSIVTDANNPYGRPTLRLAAASGYVAKNYYLAETSFKAGDTITVAWQGYGSDTFRLYVYFYNSVGADLGSSALSASTAFGGTTKTLIATATIPAGTYRIYVFVVRTGGTADFDTYFTGLFLGTFSGGVAAAYSGADAGRLSERIGWKLPAPNLLFDPFNGTTGPGAIHGTTWGGQNRFYNAAHLSIVAGDANNPFGGNTLRHASTDALAGKYAYLSELGLLPGDSISASIVIRAASGASTLYLIYYGAADELLASYYLGPSTTHSGAVTTLHAENQIIPASCAKIVVASYRTSGSAAIDIYAMSLARGRVAAQVSPSVSLLEWTGEIADARGAYGTLEARLDAIDGGNGFPSADDVYGLHLLKSWRAKRGSMANGGTAQAKILFIGDSWVYSTADRLRAKLQSLYGAAGAGFQQFVALSSYGFGGAIWTRAGTWTDVDQTAAALGPGVQHMSSSDIGTPASVQLVATANSLTIHYGKQAGGGSFRYRVDGGGWTTVSTDAAAAYATEAITGLSTASHTLDIEVTVAGAGVILIGVDVALSANGVRVNWCGNGGASAESFSQVDETLWGDAIAALAPDVVIILLGTNDHSSNVAPATFATRINTVVDRIQAELPLADIVLLSPADNGLAGKTYTVNQYVAELRGIAAAQQVAMIDAYMNVGAYADGDARGLYLNTSHPNDAGYDLLAQLLVDRLQL